MSLNATTLSAAIVATDTQVFLGALTGVTAPNYQTGAGVTYLLCEQEMMKVTSLIGTTGANVIRGELGTVASAHGASAPVVAGGVADFPNFQPAVKTAVPAYPVNFQGFSAPLTQVVANTLSPTGAYHRISGTTIIKTINLPPGMVEGGEITLVNDGSGSGLQWDATGNIGVAGTFTTAGSSVTFVFDQGAGKWTPSRLA